MTFVIQKSSVGPHIKFYYYENDRKYRQKQKFSRKVREENVEAI